MKKITVQKIADDLGLSKATVSRALQSNGGIAYATRKKIFDKARELGYDFEISKAKVGLVMPTVPSYFWKKYTDEFKRLCDEENIECRQFLFSRVDSEDDALYCIDAALAAGVEILIITVTETPKLKALLNELSKKILIILVEEYFELDNAAFIGEDNYSTGEKMAEIFLEKFPEKKNAVVLSRTAHGTTERSRAFAERFAALGGKVLAVLSYPARTGSSMPAGLAALFNPLADSMDCVFCSSSLLSDNCLAIKKLKTKREIFCIGYEYFRIDEKYINLGILKMAACQNIEEQVKKAVEVLKYCIANNKLPEEKKIYVDDEYIVFD